MIRQIGRTLAGLGFLTMLAGCQPAADPGTQPGGGGTTPAPAASRRIILINNGPDPYWDACAAGMKKAAEDLKLADEGLTVEKQDGDGTAQGQIDKLRQLATQPDVAAVGVSPVDSTNPTIAEEMRKLKAKGVPVVSLDSDLIAEFHDARFAYLGTDNVKAGSELGLAAKTLKPDGGKYVAFVGLSSAQNAKERISGFAAGAGDKFVSADTMTDGMDQQRAKENVRNALTNFPDVNTLVGIYAYNAPAIVQAVDERQQRGKYLVLTFDASTAAVKDIREGKISAMLVQNPYEIGYLGTKLMHALLKDDKETIKQMYPNHGQPGGDIYHTSLKVVVPTGDTPLKPEMFDKNTQFMTIEEFDAWLKERSLLSS